MVLAKQQADIAQKKVELDVRDRRYEVFKRWNETYLSFIDNSKIDISDDKFLQAKNKFLSTSDEIFYVFSENVLINNQIRIIKDYINNIEEVRNQWVLEANQGVWEETPYRCGNQIPTQVYDPDFCPEAWCECECKGDYNKDIFNVKNKITEAKGNLVRFVIPQMKIL